MATVHELADTVDQMRTEMARRIDELQEEKSMDHHAAASMSGILEWLGSLEDALRNCNGKPSPGSAEWLASRKPNVVKPLSRSGRKRKKA